jgi:putative Holliday junction resolvase
MKNSAIPVPLPTTGRLLGIDWGEVRIGLALSDETQTLASPLDTLLRRKGKRLPMARLLELLSQNQVVGIVVGLPLGLDGGESESSAAARELAGQLSRLSPVPIEFTDERLTTARALNVIREQGGSTRNRKADVDALAASVLLQGYLDARKGGAT